MDTLILQVHWLSVIVGAIGAYVLSLLWYSDYLFAKVWKQGLLQHHMPSRSTQFALVLQCVGIFLFAWAINVALVLNSFSFAMLITVAFAVLVKANGFYTGKHTYAVLVETSLVFAMAGVVILASSLFI